MTIVDSKIVSLELRACENSLTAHALPLEGKHFPLQTVVAMKIHISNLEACFFRLWQDIPTPLLLDSS